MSTIKEKLGKEFPGEYTVLPEAIRDRLVKLFTAYPLPQADQDELVAYLVSLPDEAIGAALSEFEEVAAFEAREYFPLS